MKLFDKWNIFLGRLFTLNEVWMSSDVSAVLTVVELRTNFNRTFSPRQWSCGKVMFSRVSFCLFTGDCYPCDHYPWCLGPQYTDPLGPLVPSWHQTREPPSPDPCPSLLNIRHGTTWPWSHPYWYWHLVAKALKLDKRIVRILLNCFLVTF